MVHTHNFFCTLNNWKKFRRSHHLLGLVNFKIRTYLQKVSSFQSKEVQICNKNCFLIFFSFFFFVFCLNVQIIIIIIIIHIAISFVIIYLFIYLVTFPIFHHETFYKQFVYVCEAPYRCFIIININEIASILPRKLLTFLNISTI